MPAAMVDIDLGYINTSESRLESRVTYPHESEISLLVLQLFPYSPLALIQFKAIQRNSSYHRRPNPDSISTPIADRVQDTPTKVTQSGGHGLGSDQKKYR